MERISANLGIRLGKPDFLFTSQPTSSEIFFPASTPVTLSNHGIQCFNGPLYPERNCCTTQDFQPRNCFLGWRSELQLIYMGDALCQSPDGVLGNNFPLEYRLGVPSCNHFLLHY